MKGPGLRLKHDVRRTWRCPACGNELAADGHVTALRCSCEQPHAFMQLIEPRRRTRPESAPLDVYFECEPEEELATAAFPVSDETTVPTIEVEASGVESGGTAGSVEPGGESEAIAAPEFASPPVETIDGEPSAPASLPPGDPPAAAMPTIVPEAPAAADQPGEGERKRKRKSRGGRRRRGRRRKPDGGTETGTSSPAGDPGS